MVLGDIRGVRRLFPPQSFDHVVSNPPYMPVDKGRLNPDSQKAIARHEILCSIGDVIAAAAYLVLCRGLALVLRGGG